MQQTKTKPYNMLYSSSSQPNTFSAKQGSIEQIKVVIADDHPLAREGIIAMLASYKEICIAGEAANGKQLIELVKRIHPDVVLTDLRMPEMDGIQTIRDIKYMDETVRCILLSQYDNDHIIVEAFQAGAMGYVVKTASKEEVFEAICCVYAFDYYYCRAISSKIRRILSDKSPTGFKPSAQSLSERDREIIYLLCEGKSNHQIGDILCISPRTVEGAKSKIMEKTNTTSTAGIIVYAIQNRLYRIYD